MRGRPPTITNDELLEAARVVFLEQGVGATTAEIARRAGVSESILFHRYKTKEALFIAVLDSQTRVPRAVERLSERVGKGDLEQNLYDLGYSIVDQMRAVMPYLMVARMMAQASTWKLDELRDRMKAPPPSHVRSLELLTGYFEAETTQGRLRPVDSKVLAQLFMGVLIQHVMIGAMTGHAPPTSSTTKAFLRGLIDMLLYGIAPPSKKAR